MLACRLERVLPSVISPDQAGFVKGRHSFYNICKLLNIVYIPCQNDSECLLSMDAEKAFGRVEWVYLFVLAGCLYLGSSYCIPLHNPANNFYSKPFN